MDQLHQSAILQAKNLENSILLYFKHSGYFNWYSERKPKRVIEIMTTVLPKVAQLQYLILKQYYEDGEYEAYEMDTIMTEIEPFIDGSFDNGAYEMDMEHIEYQFRYLKEIIEDITAEYLEV